MGEAAKAWLGENQEKGIDGLGSAKRRLRLMAESNAGTRGQEGTESMGVV